MAAIGRAGRTRAPGGNNQYMGPTGGESAGLSRETQSFPTQSSGPMNCSTANRHSRKISGPKGSSLNELEYSGT